MFLLPQGLNIDFIWHLSPLFCPQPPRLMRRNEATQGIGVKDADGNDRGISKAAGTLALKQVALTRVILPAPVLLLPPLLMRIFESFSFVKSRPALRPPLQLFTITGPLTALLSHSMVVDRRRGVRVHVILTERRFVSLCLSRAPLHAALSLSRRFLVVSIAAGHRCLPTNVRSRSGRVGARVS